MQVERFFFHRSLLHRKKKSGERVSN
ncbi:hypothetical protein A5871_001406, partial [Enterococcus sp. 2F9_DIV0599]